MNKRNGLLRLEDTPTSIREWVGILCPEPEGEKWLKEPNTVFDGKSRLEMLSVPYDKEAAQLKKNVEKVVRAFYKVLAIISMPRLASVEEVYKETIETQERAGRPKDPSTNSEDAALRHPPKRASLQTLFRSSIDPSSSIAPYVQIEKPCKVCNCFGPDQARRNTSIATRSVIGA